MRHRTKLLLSVLAATILLSFAAGTAGARRFEVANQRWRDIFVSYEIIYPFIRILCPVTMTGSFHSKTISKVSGQLIGYIQTVQARESACTGGTARALAETLPWHIRYLGFLGVLPNITALRWIVVGGRWRIASPEGLACLFTTTAANPGAELVNIEAGGNATTVRADETARIPSGAECFFGGSASIAGTGEMFAPEGGTRIRYRLVQ